VSRDNHFDAVRDHGRDKEAIDPRVGTSFTHRGQHFSSSRFGRGSANKSKPNTANVRLVREICGHNLKGDRASDGTGSGSRISRLRDKRLPQKWKSGSTQDGLGAHFVYLGAFNARYIVGHDCAGQRRA
jgi:hypothetical protein